MARALIALMCGSAVCTACGENNPAQVYTGLPLVILDTDLGSSTDDLFALEMLHRYQQRSQIQELSREGPKLTLSSINCLNSC